jgi:hypothetical protein
VSSTRCARAGCQLTGLRWGHVTVRGGRLDIARKGRLQYEQAGVGGERHDRFRRPSGGTVKEHRTTVCDPDCKRAADAPLAQT